jgi:hypothetical protein
METIVPRASASIASWSAYIVGRVTLEGRRRPSERDHREGGRVYLRAPTREYRGEGDLLLLSGEDRYTGLDIEAITLVMGYSQT